MDRKTASEVLGILNRFSQIMEPENWCRLSDIQRKEVRQAGREFLKEVEKNLGQNWSEGLLKIFEEEE